MHIRTVFFVMGILLICIGTSMLFPLFVSLYYKETVTSSIGKAFALVCLSGFILTYLCHNKNQLTITTREAFAIVGLCWIAASFAGALPYVLTIDISFTDAVFETASGFTTTGSTIFTDIEILPKSILLWRSLTHWLGGMGIILLSLAVLPLLGVGGMQLYKAEVPGPTPDKLTPHMQDTAMLLWKVYIIITLLEIAFLSFAGMDLFDAVAHTLSTVATGGFSTKNASIAAYPSPVIQWGIIVFMLAAGINFTLHYRLFSVGPSLYIKDTECFFYIKLLVITSILIILSFIAYHTYKLNSFTAIEHAVRTSVFQTVSICTTTGFISENYIFWPQIAQGLLIMLMFTGGCAGSTSGGIKNMRILVLLRIAYQEIFRLLHPNSIRFPKLDGKTIPKEVLSGIIGFFLLYIAVLMANTLVLLSLNYDLLTSFTATLTCLSNVGPGFGSVGPIDNFSHLTPPAKWSLILCMLLGRLELYAILILFIPAFWKY